MRKFFAIIASCLALCACERSFDISRQVGDATVWMTFIPSNDYDTTFFIVQATTPLAGVTEPVLTRGESVEVKVNGEQLKLEKNDRSVPDRLQFYSTDHVFKPGDVVEAVATVPGTGSVSASCEVPRPFPACSWTATKVQRHNNAYIMLVDIDYDDSGEGGYYGAAVIQYHEQESQWEDYDPETGGKYWGEIKHSTRTSNLQPAPMSDTGSLSASSENPVMVAPRYYNTLSGNHRYAQIWHDTPGGPGGKRHMTFASRCYEEPAHWETSEDSRYSGWHNNTYKYKLVLYRFSESCYNYLKARYNDSHNDFSGLGLAPSSFVYTNVAGGAGVCGAYVVSESDWMQLD